MKSGSGKYDSNVPSPKSNVLRRIKDIFGGGTGVSPDAQEDRDDTSSTTTTTTSHSSYTNYIGSGISTGMGSGGGSGGGGGSGVYNNNTGQSNSTMLTSTSSQQQHGQQGLDNNNNNNNNNNNAFSERFKNELTMSRTLNAQARLSYLKDVSEFLKMIRIEDCHNIDIVWSSICDLFDENRFALDLQQMAYNVMMTLMEQSGTGPGTGITSSCIRQDFFNIIESSTTRVPIHLRIRALTALTRNGRDISPFEDYIADLLVRWLGLVLTIANETALTSFVTDIFALVELVIRHSQRRLSEGNLASLINNICMLSNSSTHIVIIECSLSFFNLVTSQVVIPPPCVSMIIASLSRTVNIDVACDPSCTTMQSLLASYTHQGIKSLCDILNDPHNRHTINLLRGSVFFLGMSVWGPQRIPTIGISPAFILPSLFNSLVGGQEIIAFEVILAIRRLIKKFGRELHVEWDLIFLIIESIHILITAHPESADPSTLSHSGSNILSNNNMSGATSSSGSLSIISGNASSSSSVANAAMAANDTTATSNLKINSLAIVLRDTIWLIEDLDDQKLFLGSHTDLFRASSLFFKLKSEEQLIKIITHQMAKVHPSHALWIIKLTTLVDLFLKKDTRTKVRRRMLHELKQLYHTYRLIYGEEIIENILIPAMSDVYKDRDATVRLFSLDLLVEITTKAKTPSIFHTLVTILDRAIRESHPMLDVAHVSLQGLISVFSARFVHPSATLTMEAWSTILAHMSHESHQLRREILHCVSKLLSTKWYQMQYDGVSSPFIHCAPNNHFFNDVSSASVQRSPRGGPVNAPNPHVPQGSIGGGGIGGAGGVGAGVNAATKKKKGSNALDGFFPVANVWAGLMDRLNKETSFELYSITLEILSSFLRNKYILFGMESHIEAFVNILIRLLNEKSLGHSITDYQNSEGRKDCQYILGFELLCNVIPYMTMPMPNVGITNIQQTVHNVVAALFNGLCQKWSFSSETKLKIQAICLNGLTLCATEFPLKITLKYIQNIAKALHQISTSGATQKETFYSILQYLNVLVSTPTLVSQLPLESLTFIFKLLIQFLDRSRYNHLLVLMAFQSLIRWFTACSDSSRVILVRNIIKGIDGHMKEKQALFNEICVELLNRYIHTDFDPFHYPMRHSSPIFHEGLIKTWIQGCSLITIRTGKLGWAEVTHRKATGCVVWLMRFQNNFNPSITSNYDLYMGINNQMMDSQLVNLPKQPYFRKEFSPTSPLSPSLSPVMVPGGANEVRSYSPAINQLATSMEVDRLAAATSPSTTTTNTSGANANASGSHSALTTATTTHKSSEDYPIFKPIQSKLDDLAKRFEIPSIAEALELSLSLSLLPEDSSKDTMTPIHLISSHTLLTSPNQQGASISPSPASFAEVHKEDEVEEDEQSSITNTQQQQQVLQHNDESIDVMEDLVLESSGHLDIPLLGAPSMDKPDSLFLTSNIESPFKYSYGSGENTPPNPLSTLSKYYPPLPSFDDDEEILSFTTNWSSPLEMTNDVVEPNGKLNLNAQLLLHVGSNSPPSTSTATTMALDSNSNPIEITQQSTPLKLVKVPSSNSSTNNSPTKQTEIFSLSVDEETSPYLTPKKMARHSYTNSHSSTSNEYKIASELSSAAKKEQPKSGTTLGSPKLVKSTSFTLESQGASSSSVSDPLVSPTPTLEPTPTQSPLDTTFHSSHHHHQKQQHSQQSQQSNNVSTSQSSFKPVSPLQTGLTIIPKEGPIKPTNNNNNNNSSSIIKSSTTTTSSQSSSRMADSSIKSAMSSTSTTSGMHGDIYTNNFVPPISIPPNLNHFSQHSLNQAKMHYKRLPLIHSATSQNIGGAHGLGIGSGVGGSSGSTPIQIQAQQLVQQQRDLYHQQYSKPHAFQQQHQPQIASSSSFGQSTLAHYKPKYPAPHAGFSPTQTQPPSQLEQLKSNIYSSTYSSTPQTTSFSHIPSLFDDDAGLPKKHSSLNYDTTSVDPTILDPSVVFYHLHQFSGDITMEIKTGHTFERALSVLDHTFCSETYKIGLIYVGTNQKTEEEFLANTKGSPRYQQFLNGLGEKVRISERIDVYPGGLDRNGKSDGDVTIHWRDRISQIVFHVTTMMPNHDNDKMFTNKKRHIGNDYVNIIFSDSGDDFNPQLISGQFNFVTIVIHPMDIGWYRVEIKKKKEIPLFGPIHNVQIVSERSIASLVIQTAINANLMSMLYDGKTEFISNLEERLRQIKTIKERFAKEDDGWIDLVPSKR
ncbi:hypothetical protein SAMD00019534_023830 [Acytostelium subglobosum LB1]|uniref:hypothetical protein n=1 Tax=Acytostelium subglobosum LB1 TaxID=1410327 RepID=UPI000644DB59|nr:hypothetical protein SAMD00019534_023830 [Acytostelium subglobosum LB1]GAM19208.1 hypothetical protein SAMD00019534_023830 [Acytostelium subglobosum LB1]|eukprot:XP_012757135.1 hypothetical protein SAMD00019534_023830 [Acytostelium subglobosum LB1]